MERASKWFALFRPVLLVGIGITTVELSSQIFYLQQAYILGMDPLDSDSYSVLAFGIYLFSGLAAALLDLAIVILLMGYMLRSTQWVKSHWPDEFKLRPGWSIWGWIIPFVSYIVPYQILSGLLADGLRKRFFGFKGAGLLVAYWLPHLVSGLVSAQQAKNVWLGPEKVSFDDFVSDEWMTLITQVLDIASYALLIPLIALVQKHLLSRQSRAI